jgi:hypothetical protein
MSCAITRLVLEIPDLIKLRESLGSTEALCTSRLRTSRLARRLSIGARDTRGAERFD